MIADSPVQPEDVIPVRSRISWGAIVAGSVLALSLYFLLALLGGAVGLSISDKVNSQSLSNGAIVYVYLGSGPTFHMFAVVPERVERAPLRHARV